MTPDSAAARAAASRLRALAKVAPGYAAALRALAAEVDVAAQSDPLGVPEAAAAGMSDADWLAHVSAAILGDSPSCSDRRCR